MSDEKAYGYAVARIRAMEPLLLDSSVYQRMLDADGSEGALKVLGETVYGKYLGTEATGTRYDIALESELLSTFNEFSSFIPDKGLVDIFRIPYDFHNIKVVIKGIINAKSGGKRRHDLLSDLGIIPTEKLASAIESEDYSSLPFGLASLIPECLATYDQSHDIAELEKTLDHHMFRTILNISEKTGIGSVVLWVKARIDSENIRNLLRLKRFGIEQNEIPSYLHDSGSIKVNDLITVYNEPFENWSQIIGGKLGDVLSNIHDESSFDKLIVDVEISLDDHCQACLAKARYSTSSPDNIIAYLWGKEQEMKNIRTILVSKSTDSSSDETRRLMRHGY